MTIQQLASLFNLTSSALILLVSLTVIRTHPKPYFRQWLWAYGVNTLLLGVEFWCAFHARSTPLALGEVALCVTAGWFYCGTAATLLDLRLPIWEYAVLLAVALMQSGVSLALGVPYAYATAPTVVLFALSQILLGLVLLAQGRAGARTRVGNPWLGWPQLAIGVWIFLYPLTERSPFFFAGFLGSALLDILVGVAMLVFLLEQASEQLSDQNAQLVSALQHKRTFPSIVSHELRTPLAAIMGFHELLEDEVAGPLTDQQQEFLGQMRTSAAQLSSLIDSLLDTFLLESDSLHLHDELIDIESVIQDALLAFLPSIKAKSLHLEVAVAADTPPARADAQRVVQVLQNLLGNAIKFTDVGGSIRVRAQLTSGKVCVEVTDSGVGIPTNHLPHVFDSFFQGDGTLTRRYGGFGLGLSLVKALVHRMGGEVGVQSSTDTGSCFSFTLPAAGDLKAGTSLAALVESKAAPPH